MQKESVNPSCQPPASHLFFSSQQTPTSDWENSQNVIFMRVQAHFLLISRQHCPWPHSAMHSLVQGNSVCSSEWWCPLNCKEMGILSYAKDFYEILKTAVKQSRKQINGILCAPIRKQGVTWRLIFHLGNKSACPMQCIKAGRGTPHRSAVTGCQEFGKNHFPC